MTATTPSTDDVVLPVPRTALLELGLTEAQIQQAIAARPLVLAFQADEHPGAVFDVDRVRRVLKALGHFRHTKGRWARDRRRLRLGEGLDPWQVVWVIAPVFGWVSWDDEAGAFVRVIRTVWIEIPRKNGKSTIVAGIGNVLLLADSEVGAEVYAAAGGKEQARRVFDDAKRMCLSAPAVRRRIRPLAEVITVPHTGALFRVLSRIAEIAHGLNVHAALVDEVHVHRSRDLVDALETGTGARDQPLIIFITTADEAVDGSIYDEKHNYTRLVATRVVADPSHYGVIWAAEDDDDPFAEATWRKANPGLGVSPSLRYLRTQAERARTTPSFFPTFCRLHLNRRMRGTSRLIDLVRWDACADAVDLDHLAGRRAWGGLDLAAVSDFTAWWMGVDSPCEDVELDFLWRFYVPSDRVPDLKRQLQVPLDTWIEQGLVVATEGDVVDYDAIQRDVVADCRRVDMQRVSYDRMFAGQLVQHLDSELGGVDVVPVAQNYLGTSPAIKELQRLLGATGPDVTVGRIRHGGHPVARWMASVVETRNDGMDNLKLVKPDRLKSLARIDGISAAVTGLDGYLRRPRPTSSRMIVRR